MSNMLLGAGGTDRALVAGDPHWASVVLLASFDGTNGATAFNDESSSARGAATFWGGAALSNTHSKFGTTSLRTLSSGSPGGVSWPDSADFEFSNGNWTVECFAYFNAVGGGISALMGHWDHSTSQHSWLMYSNAGVINYASSTSGSDTNFDASYTPSGAIDTQFRHYAFDCDGTKIRLYFDGVMKTSTTTIRNLFNTNSRFAIGMDGVNANFNADCWFSEVRVTKGVARYATDTSFTAPTAAFPRS